MDAFADQFELVDHRLHAAHQFPPRRQGHLPVVYKDWTFGQPPQCLEDDPPALPHLVHPHPVPVERISVGSHGYVELVVGVAAVWKRLAHIIGDTRPAEDRPGATIADGVLGTEHSDPFRALAPDEIVCQQRLVLVQPAGKVVQKPLHTFRKSLWEIPLQPADPEVPVHHALPGDHLEDVEDLLAVTEAVHEQAGDVEVDRRGAQVDEMAGDTRELGQDKPDDLGALRGGDAEQLFDCQDVGLLLDERSQILDPRRKDDVLMVRPGLHLLLKPGVQVADDGLEIEDDLALQLQHQSEHPMGGGVLRAHVEDEGFLHCLRMLRLRLRDDLAGDSRRVALELDGLFDERVILAQRMPFPVVGHEDAPQVGMAVKADAKQVEDFPLQPVCPRPQ